MSNAFHHYQPRDLEVFRLEPKCCRLAIGHSAIRRQLFRAKHHQIQAEMNIFIHQNELCFHCFAIDENGKNDVNVAK